MDETISISKARSTLLDLPKAFSRKKDSGAVTVTRRGKPILAIMPWDFYESIVETLEVMADPDLRNSLSKSIKEMTQGRLLSWEKVKKDLKL